MKSFFTLAIMLFAKTTLVSGIASAGHGAERSSPTGHHLRSDELVIAQAVPVEDQESSYRDALDVMLARDDFAAANNYLNELSDDPEITPAILRSLKSQIRRVRTARIVGYAEEIRAAIASSDFDAVKELSARMQRLRSPQPSNGLASRNNAERRAPKVETDRVIRAEKGQSSPDAGKATTDQPSLTAEDAILALRMRTALEEDRLFPPGPDNAFDLAMVRLSAVPDDPKARDILDDVIKKRQSQILANLEDGRPEIALELNEQLRSSVGSLRTEGAMLTLRSSAERWAEQTRPGILAGLIANTEKAIEGYRLTIAPGGQLSAESHVALLATELGRDHDDVKLLASNIIARYQGLIERRLAQRQYDRATDFHARMEATARRFDVSIDQVIALGSEIERSRTKDHHDDLLLQATAWRDKGQLIEPAGANALELAGKAASLPLRSDVANKLINDVIVEHREGIDSLIKDGRLEQAAGQLKRLGSAIEQTGTGQADQASLYYAEAEQLLQRLDAARAQRQQRIEEANVEPAEAETSPFTFINPF